MPLIHPSLRKSTRTRVLLAVFYLLLSAGALTMVYPFLLMLAGSTKSQVDEHEFRVVPTFFRDDTMLWRKHAEALFNESLVACRVAYDREIPSFAALPLETNAPPALVAAWTEFLAGTNLPHTAWTVGHLEAPVSKTLAANLRRFKDGVSSRHGGALDEVNRALGTEFPTWASFDVDAENFLSRREKWLDSPLQRAVRDFKLSRPAGERYAFSVTGYFHQEFLRLLFGRDIAAYNRRHGTAHATFEDIPLPVTAPSEPSRRAEWEEFVRTLLNPLWIRVDAAARPAYQAFLRAKYRSVAALNRAYGRQYGDFMDVPLLDELPAAGLVTSDWESLLSGWTDPDTGEAHRFDVAHLRIHGVEHRFREALLARHGSLAALNQALGTAFTCVEEIQPPQAAAHAAHFAAHRGEIFREFCTRGFRHVADYLLLHGRGVWNTFVYCGLSVLLSLIVNPLAAYALSRFRLRSRYAMLFFLLLTMAFPPMVTQIPVFLMLRDLGLLNSFAALLLPHLANGYSIFLLKGFFDSLPREMYESAEIDGAGEWTMFWTMTMSMSKPILAVVALGAFTAAYGNFMFALLLCQDQRMWTIMVWLFKLQQESGDAVVYASLILAAIPTFLIFAFCQKLILRGIVVPMDK